MNLRTDPSRLGQPKMTKPLRRPSWADDKSVAPTPNDALALLDQCRSALRQGPAQRRAEVSDAVVRFAGAVAEQRWPEDYSEDPEWEMRHTAYDTSGPIWTDGTITAWVEDFDGRRWLTVGDADGQDGRSIPLAALWAIMRDDED